MSRSDDRDLLELRRRLEARERDHDAWKGVARWTARRGVAPDFVDWRRHRAAIRAATRANPKDQGLRLMVLTMLGLEPAKDGGPAEYWTGKRRPRRSKGWLVDPTEGMPLIVRHLRTGQILRWVPHLRAPLGWGGHRLRGRPWPRPNPGLRIPDRAGGGYLAQHPVTVEGWSAYLDASDAGDPGTPARWDAQCAGDTRCPVRGITQDQAAAYQAWAGGALPGEFDWELAARGDDRRNYPWGNKVAPGLAISESWWRQLLEAQAGFRGPGWPVEPAPPAVGEHPKSASPFGIQEMCGYLVEYPGDDAHLRGGVAIFAVGGGAPIRQLETPWEERTPGRELEVRPAEAFWRRWRSGQEYPRSATTRLWIPVDAPIHEDPAAWGRGT